MLVQKTRHVTGRPDCANRLIWSPRGAVAGLPVLLEYLLPFVKTGGLAVAMKGPDVRDEVANSRRALAVLGGEIEDVTELVLPGDQRRSLIRIRKTGPCPDRYPRPAGKPDKAPIL